MTHDELEASLRGMRGTSRQVYGLFGEHETLTDAAIREKVGRNGSISDRLEPLLAAGLIRHAGKDGRQQRYEATPLAQVEEAAQRWAVRRPKKKTRRGGRPKLSDLMTMTPGGHSAEFYREYKWIAEAGTHVRANEVQLFWESAPFEDIELLAPLVDELAEAAASWRAAFDVRKGEEDARRKIASARALAERTNGTPEGAAAAAAAAKLEKRLL